MNWKATSLAVIVVVVACATAFYAGRTSAPVTVEEKIVDRVVEVEKIRWETRTKLVLVKDTERARDTKIVIVESPDGSKRTEIHETERESIKERTDLNQKEVVYQDRIVFQDRTVEKLVEADRPNWRIGVLAGVDASMVDFRNPVADQPWKVGAEVQRRIIGPVQGGVWGFTDGSVGLSLSWEF